MEPRDHISAFSSYPKSGQGFPWDLKIFKIIGSILRGEPITVWWAVFVFLVENKNPLILILAFNKFKSFLSSSVSKFTKILSNFKFLWIILLLCKYLMASTIAQRSSKGIIGVLFLSMQIAEKTPSHLTKQANRSILASVLRHWRLRGISALCVSVSFLF